MTDFQIIIFSSDGENGGSKDRFAIERHGGGKKAVAKIDELAEIWDTVVEKLTAIASATKANVENSPYELDTIEFNVGIEAGLDVGLVTKGNASVSVAFKKKDEVGSLK